MDRYKIDLDNLLQLTVQVSLDSFFRMELDLILNYWLGLKIKIKSVLRISLHFETSLSDSVESRPTGANSLFR